MGYNNPDPYYQPEKFDLVPVAEIDYSDGCYQFDYRVVWKHDSTGTLYTARDAGCSCPSPFEEYNSLDQLSELNLAALEAEVAAEREDTYFHHRGSVYEDFLRKVREASQAG